MLTLIRGLCLLPFLLTLSRADDLCLASAGRARSVVVVPANGEVSVRVAANNLASYLDRMTQSRFQILSEDDAADGQLQIHVGPTAAVRRYLPAHAADHPERQFIRRIPEGLLLCGGGAPGTQQAVWRFLELLGCRWLTQRPEDEVVPQFSELILPSDFPEVDTTPAFDWRLFRGTTNERAVWGEKLGFNGFFPPGHADAHPCSLFWPSEAAGVHTHNHIIALSDYAETHPEWFALLNGRRPRPGDPGPRQLCLTAPGLLDEFTHRVRQLVDAKPGTPVISISPEDGFGWCECSACQQLDLQLGSGHRAEVLAGRSEPVVSDRLFWFCNQVAEKMAGSHPEVRLVVLAYINYVEPPKTVRPAGNVVPFVCHYWPADHSRSIADSTSAENRRFHDMLQRWARISPQMMFYSYTGFSSWWRLPRPILRTTIADMQLCQQLGIRGFYCQDVFEDWELNGPLHYVLGHMLHDPYADPDQLTDEWLAGMFGTAAVSMRRHYDLVEKSVRRTPTGFRDDPRGQVPELYDALLLQEARRALRAASAAAETKQSRERVAAVATVFERGFWLIRILEERANRGQFADIWLQGLLWLSAMSCLLRAAWIDRREISAGRTGTPGFLLLSAILCGSFWLDSLLDIRQGLIDRGRQLVQEQSWYGSRMARQIVFSAVAVSGALTALGLLSRLIRSHWRLNQRVLAAMCLLLIFQLLQVTAFDQASSCSWLDQADISVRAVSGGVGLQWLVSLLATALCLRPRSRFQPVSSALA
ncbi:MAG: DUF4838 domain-containing protein [Planctomycetota bacterium]